MNCYHLSQIKLSWDDAILACDQNGTRLLTIENDEEYIFINSRYNYRLWTGYKTNQLNGKL